MVRGLPTGLPGGEAGYREVGPVPVQVATAYVRIAEKKFPTGRECPVMI